MSTRLCTCGVGDGDWPEDHTDRCDMMRPQIHDPNADLADIRTKWLAFCSVHDNLDVDLPCCCAWEDHRPLIAALVTEVETLRAEVGRLEGERDEAEAEVERQQRRVLAAEQRNGRNLDRIEEAEADLAALHAEAARLATDRAKAHALVAQVMAWRAAPRSSVNTADHILIAAVDQMAPSAPLSVRQGDDRGEPAVTATDTVEPQQGVEGAAHACRCGGLDPIHGGDDV